MPDARSVVAGSRGSRLARAQTEWVLKQLAVDAEVRIVTTEGDRSGKPARGDGLFVKEIEHALLTEEIDFAVHSLKDMPTAPVEGLQIAAIPTRADAREVLVGSTLTDLKPGAKIGTSSPRRSAQLLALRPDVMPTPIRGNVPTRIDKARAGEFDAVLLAAAGLERLGLLGETDEMFEYEVILPAPGQGALAVQCREDDDLAEILAQIDDPECRTATQAERDVLRALGGGCMLPVAAFGVVVDGVLSLRARVVSADGRRIAESTGEGKNPEYVVDGVVAELIDRGAKELLDG